MEKINAYENKGDSEEIKYGDFNAETVYEGAAEQQESVNTGDSDAKIIMNRKKKAASLKKATNWLSSFIESYSPPLDGERYLTDKELSELLKLSRRTLQEYRKQGILPYIILCGKTLYPESEIQTLLTGNYRKPIIDGTVSQGEGTAS